MKWRLTGHGSSQRASGTSIGNSRFIWKWDCTLSPVMPPAESATPDFRCQTFGYLPSRRDLSLPISWYLFPVPSGMRCLLSCRDGMPSKRSSLSVTKYRAAKRCVPPTAFGRGHSLPVLFYSRVVPWIVTVHSLPCCPYSELRCVSSGDAYTAT